MIIVPIEENKTGLATATDAKFRAPDYSGSGLEALGAGLAQLGEGGRQLAGGIEERRRRAAEAIAAAMLDDRHQGNIDDAAVKQAYIDYSDRAHEALHGDDLNERDRRNIEATLSPALFGAQTVSDLNTASATDPAGDAPVGEDATSLPAPLQRLVVGDSPATMTQGEAGRPGLKPAPFTLGDVGSQSAGHIIEASFTPSLPITFDDHGKPVVGNDGKSFGQSAWEAFTGTPKPPASPPQSKPPTRKEIISSGGTAGKITIRSNPGANGQHPFNEDATASRAGELEPYILKASKKYHVDANLIRAIIYMETTHGWYDAPLRPFDLDKSILPMNINTNYWGTIWGTRAELRDPARNIDGGTRMLKAILTAMPHATVAKVATIYNDSNASMVNDYGARVDRIYRQRPWLVPLSPADPSYVIGTRSTLP